MCGYTGAPCDNHIVVELGVTPAVLLSTVSWRFAFPGDSRVLVIPVWRFPTCQHVLAGRGGLVVVLQLKVVLVAFGAPAPSSI